ncbi:MULTISPECIES: LLM class flavin-dependent oxidoreductase [Streptomyces]|uniref:LLM class flavin-dependent oxidoreductase n=1 Tax=Streptomyces rhizosphaericola TaxID=2564098 RepID=A0ABY2P6M1_9ACTN|nr:MULTISPECIES: LLM class flavin-dependent oxidoreductase [Streptomyces]MYT97530.1 LLM class flavin-dependent oxidoreductase [Streptomyces sp. SID8350]NGO86867.1 LLM class flavin-dependent oxidoreductase [Streptomyces sp. 196(2019)]TGZ00375.1 LLM class flavin-dependent oxidoreductase [Streptomyces rhizosphaericola]SCK14900.1 Flavin-dependent oxidoreductase, luciferase family (includes alkanesulfonate monooxygenase SsuD and methylene tetrahydromethanopterin reductase) [Streptomyces sp. AmelKG-D
MRIGTFVLAAQFPGQGPGEALHRAVRSAEAAEESGLDSVWLAEHHFVPYGVCPSATTLAALLLGRTRRIRVGTAVSVLPNHHPVALAEQAALLHLTSGGRFSLGVGRGGPWVDLEVFGGGLDAYENGFPESLGLLLDWLRKPRVAGRGERFGFREVAVVPRADELLADGAARGPEVIVACTSPKTVRLAAGRGLPMLLGMHCGDEEKAEMVALWRTAAREAGQPPEVVEGAAHVSAGVAQIEDGPGAATETLVKTMPGWLRQGLDAHVTVDGRHRVMRDPVAYTELLCGLHPVGPPRVAADRLAATAERTGISRFALLVEGSGDLAATEENVRRLGADVLPLLT